MHMRPLVFVGMPGSGKTTVSQLVAEALNRPWFDCDLEIEAAAGMSIPDIFAGQGEEAFRALETECLKRLLKQESAVIATGGGAVLRNEALLRERAAVVYLRREVEAIASTLRAGTRPLVKDEDSLRTLYGQRREIYERVGDFTVDNDGAVEEAVRRTLEVLK